MTTMQVFDPDKGRDALSNWMTRHTSKEELNLRKTMAKAAMSHFDADKYTDLPAHQKRMVLDSLGLLEDCMTEEEDRRWYVYGVKLQNRVVLTLHRGPVPPDRKPREVVTAENFGIVHHWINPECLETTDFNAARMRALNNHHDSYRRLSLTVIDPTQVLEDL